MQIFGTSLQQAADTFLHAGYISVNPNLPYIEDGYPMFQDLTDTGTVTTLDAALQLAEPGSSANAMVWGAGWLETLPGVALALSVAVAAGTLAWWAAQWLGDRRLPVPALRALPALAVALVIGACAVPPWQDLTPRDYADPLLANQVLTHVLVHEGLAAYSDEHGRAYSLAAIQDYVLTPDTTPSEGQEYALQAYGLDGWGHEYDFTYGDGRYVLTSAGPDGDFDTADDRSFDLYKDAIHCWYLARVDGQLYALQRFHFDGGSNADHVDLDAAWEDNDDGSEFVQLDELPGYFFALPITADWLVEHVWQYGPNESEPMDPDAAVATIEAFYDSHITAEDPDPVVVQLFNVPEDTGV